MVCICREREREYIYIYTHTHDYNSIHESIIITKTDGWTYYTIEQYEYNRLCCVPITVLT